MCKCLNPDPTLYECIDHVGLEQYVKQIEGKWEGNPRFPYGICGAMWYGTPVVKETAHHRIKWRYGVEFEVEFKRVTVDGETEYEDFYRNVAIVANNYLGQMTKWRHGGITEDYSLDRGFEIVLPAMSIVNICSHIQPILLDSFINPYLRHNGNAAMHITVDPFETVEQQKAFHDFWDHPSFFDDFECITRRRENSYCRRRGARRNWRGANGFMKPDTLAQHYHRCNVRSNGAMEVRVFQAGYDDYFGVATAQLQLVDRVNRVVRRGVFKYDDIKDTVKQLMGI